MEAATFIECEDEQSLFPLRAGTESIINTSDQLFAVRDQTAGVH